MSLKERLAVWSPVPAYTVRELLPRERQRVPRFTGLDASLVDCALRVRVTEELPERSCCAAIHVAARFGAVLELVSHPPGDVPQHGRQTIWTVQSDDCEATADRFARTSAELVLEAPPLSLLLGLVPTEPGTKVSLVRARWSELLVTDLENGVTNRIPGTWTVFDAASRPNTSAAVR
ncbi:hypothetical protein SPF06_00610 [Sinomonas sp. JGH33]|uniref:Uncharacterized protein n=1 Tax=Sinomonas terricola TaxID=3110330 RepID=A0ABU5T0N3_9MICC|nr:hypothetical protein [Sinomonas sp. JGH33]MEA5453210.1 hypothetical protein [Sinomonas sp. JGH33]